MSCKKIAFAALSILVLAQILSGCAAYNAAMDERSIGTQYDDRKLSNVIEAKFLEDETVKFMDFDADCYYGQCFIVGEYGSRKQIDRAIAIAKSVEGVQKVTAFAYPKVKDDPCGTADNLEIYAQLKKELVADKEISSTNVKIKTVQCNIVLLGILGSNAERNKVVSHAKAIPGAKSVKSYLKLRR